MSIIKLTFAIYQIAVEEKKKLRRELQPLKSVLQAFDCISKTQIVTIVRFGILDIFIVSQTQGV